MKYDIKDAGLAKKGRLRTEWAGEDMPVLKTIRQRFQKEKPLKGIKISACLHITSETANLIQTLKSGGANVVACASNPLSTQDDISATLVKDDGIPVFAIKGEDNKTYYKHLESALSINPNITMDDGADLVGMLHTKSKDKGRDMIGGTEETTTGVIRLKSLQNQNLLLFPVIAVNDADTKHFFDNRYGTGQSTIDGILRATNRLLAGSQFVVCGYGWCGKGVAMRARGMGANVTVTETDPLRALEAVMDGFTVLPSTQAAKIGDIFVTVTGNISVLREEHFKVMKDGAILANAGHFNVEIDIDGLSRISISKKDIRDMVKEYRIKNGRRIFVLAEGRLINLTSAEGHPACVMDMSFANQALAAEYMVKNKDKLEKKVYSVPRFIDEMIAQLKLEAMGIKCDILTKEQKKYLASWEMGT